MIKKFCIGIMFLSVAMAAVAQQINNGKIKIYFNTPVNTAVSSGVNAVYLNKSADDTLINYINRAKYTIDVAVYDYSQSSNFSDIAAAINAAYNRGVKIRWIYDSTEANTGLTALNAAIHKLPAKGGTFAGIMHNKFLIFDAKSTNTADPIVWTGSMNLKEDQINEDPNNIIIVQDKSFASAYLTEFNEMWGDTGVMYNTTTSKFGSAKTKNTQTQFTIDGVNLELYFSPTDSTSEHIMKEMNDAQINTYFGIYTFTDTFIANILLTNIQQKAVNTFGIFDYNSTVGSNNKPYTVLKNVMTNKYYVYNLFGKLYHNKLCIIDANTNSNPTVVSGSHNWTKSANTRNDENTIIFHNSTIANIYFQSFWQNFADLGDATILSVDEITEKIAVYPNPMLGEKIFINTDAVVKQLELTDILGRNVDFSYENTTKTISIDNNLPKGCYFLKINSKFVQQLIK